MLQPTKNWFHISVTTYGGWLDGDPRGFRTRHHRKHVEGDYRRPPRAGEFATRYQNSKRSLSQSPIRLNASQRHLVGEALLESFQDHGALVIAVAMSGQHGHVLAQLVDRRARHWTGLAKKNAAFALRASGFIGMIWGVRSKAVPVNSRSHQVRAFHYILRHETQHAWVWRYRQES